MSETKREQAAMILGLIASQRMGPMPEGPFVDTSIWGIATDYELTDGIDLATQAFQNTQPYHPVSNDAEGWAAIWGEAESMVRSGWSPA